jgi:hypothetical protein
MMPEAKRRFTNARAEPRRIKPGGATRRLRKNPKVSSVRLDKRHVDVVAEQANEKIGGENCKGPNVGP